MTDIQFPRHSQVKQNDYAFFISRVCQAGLYEMQKNYVALLNMPVGLLNRELAQNAVGAFTKKRQMLGLSDEYPDIAVAYISGGRVANLAMRTLNGYIGLYNEYEAVLNLPPRIKYLKNNATKDGKNLHEMSIDVLSEMMLDGNAHIVADVDKDNKIRFVIYKNDARINWETEGSDKDDYRYTQIVFKETMTEGDIVDGIEEKDVYLKYWVKDGIYTITKYDNAKNILDERQPKYLGKTLDYVPIVSSGAIDNSPDIDSAPLMPIMQIMVAILGMDTELSHFNMMATAPTLVVTGADEDDLPPIMGPGVALALPQYTSKAYYTTVDSGNLEHMRNKMNDAYAEAQEYGASLLGSSKNMSESGEALRLRQQATTVNLRSVVGNMGKAIARSLKMAADWMREASNDITYEPNREFSTFTLTAAELQALVQAWQAGSLSHTTLLYNVRKSGMLQPGETIEDEIERLKNPEERFQQPDNSSNSSSGVVQGDKATKVSGA